VTVLNYDPTADATALETQIETWVNSEPIVQLVSAFGGAGIEPSDSLSVTLEKLVTFTERWDFRKGTERNLAETRNFADDQAELILGCADALGFVVSPAPRFDSYDHVIVLGGLVRACLQRPLLVAQLVANGMTTRSVTGIGAFRPLGGNEPDLARSAGLDHLENEFDAMDAGMRDAFRLTEPQHERGQENPENPNLSWHVREYLADSGSKISVTAAPSTDPKRRANTPDSYKYWAEELAEVTPGQRVLLATTAIYIPFQHADAIRMLGIPYGLIVDTVGVDASTVSIAGLSQSFTPSAYLQEVRSTIMSYRNLLLALENPR
jgi:hypothetical protein